jgi:hypothetical protein
VGKRRKGFGGGFGNGDRFVSGNIRGQAPSTTLLLIELWRVINMVECRQCIQFPPHP